MMLQRQSIYLIAGVGMIVGAFFAGAKALGGILAVTFFVASTDFTNTDPSVADNLVNTIKTGHISNAVHGIASCLILFFGGKWMLRGPKLINRWIDGSKNSKGFPSSEGLRDEAKSSEQTTEAG